MSTSANKNFKHQFYVTYITYRVGILSMDTVGVIVEDYQREYITGDMTSYSDRIYSPTQSYQSQKLPVVARRKTC